MFRMTQSETSMPSKKVVHIIGTGTIGEPLIGLFADKKDHLGFDEVTFHKRTPLLTDRSKVTNLLKRGARLACDESARRGFREIGIEPAYDHAEALRQATVVIDCTPSDVGLQNKKEIYEKYAHNTLGFIAQGSEFGFGKMYARGINDSTLKKGVDQYIQVVSCNTHNLAVIIDLIGLRDQGPDQFVEGRFTCIRRSNDISQDSSFVPSPQVNRHKDERFGTHHARDAWHLFHTLGYDLNLYSSALKVNSQYMHAIHFNLRLAKPTTTQAILERIKKDDRMALTYKQSANSVFSFGRDYGHYGRILNQGVLVVPTLTVHNGREVVGFCFTPQDGNALISSVAAACWFVYPESYEQKLNCLNDSIFDEV
jgi:glyceraldehyde-3-phosphate dehydrogenase/erythrose-4-phosphate dehydrogenase